MPCKDWLKLWGHLFRNENYIYPPQQFPFLDYGWSFYPTRQMYDKPWTSFSLPEFDFYLLKFLKDFFTKGTFYYLAPPFPSVGNMMLRKRTIIKINFQVNFGSLFIENHKISNKIFEQNIYKISVQNWFFYTRRSKSFQDKLDSLKNIDL